MRKRAKFITFSDCAREAYDNYDDATWEIYWEYGQSLIKKCANPEYKNDDGCAALARMFLFMVGRGFRATQFSITPWEADTFRLDEMAFALMGQINNGAPVKKMATILECLNKAFKLKNKFHPSWLTKTCHILWPEYCPLYDSRAIQTLSVIGQKIDGCKLKNRNQWNNSPWDVFIDEMTNVRLLLGRLDVDGRITDFHELDKVLYYWGKDTATANKFAKIVANEIEEAR